jgi:hypothetical protein
MKGRKGRRCYAGNPIDIQMRPMNVPRAARILLSLAAGSALFSGFRTAARAAEGAEFITAVSSTTSKDYVRAKLPDGSFQQEDYSFGKGGKWRGASDDPSIDKLEFLDVARVIAVPLAEQKYFPAKDPNKTRLVIMVYWGTTQVADRIDSSEAFVEYQDIRNQIGEDQPPPNPQTQRVTADANPSSMNDAPHGDNAQMNEMDDSLTLMNMENANRTRIDARNAKMLGYNTYDNSGLVGTDRGVWLGHTPLANTQHDLTAEIEKSRYFVVLMAYDFQIMWKQKKHKLLWETRFSIDQPHNDFTKALPAMAKYASRYFGQNSHGLIREPLREGDVQIGEPTLVELLAEPKK